MRHGISDVASETRQNKVKIERAHYGKVPCLGCGMEGDKKFHITSQFY